MPIDLRDQYFGTEIEMTGITRQRAAQVVAEMFGTDYYHPISYDSWCVRDQQGKEWKFSSDGSIITERKVRGLKTCADGEFATEMVSPKLEYSEMGKLQEVVRCLRHHGAFVNSSCGQHVHVDASKHTPRSLKNAMTIMYSKEDILFKALRVQTSRERNYCQKVRPAVLEKIRKMPNSTMKKAIVPTDGSVPYSIRLMVMTKKVSVSTEPHRCTVAPKGIMNSVTVLLRAGERRAQDRATGSVAALDMVPTAVRYAGR